MRFKADAITYAPDLRSKTALVDGEGRTRRSFSPIGDCMKPPQMMRAVPWRR